MKHLSTTKRRLAALTGLVALSAVSAIAIATGAELVTAELDGTANNVNVNAGSSANFNITMSATGNVACGSGTHTATVDTAYSISSGGVVTGSTPSAAQNFPAGSSCTGQNAPITGGPYVIAASVSVNAATPAGSYTIDLSEAAGTTATFDPNSTGGKLDDTTPTTLTFVVAAAPPPPTNQDPVVDTAATDADGTEGDTLASSGKFTDPDNDSLTLTADNTEGTFTDNGDGTWTWSLPTNDDVTGGTITVTAGDGNGGTATDDFHYSAANADPSIDSLGITGTNCDPELSFTVSDVGTADTESGSVDWDDGNTDLFSGNAGDSFGPLSHHYGSAGSYTIQVDVADDDGGTDSDSTTSHTVYNVPSTILQPINYTGPRSAFKLGSSIPVKIKVADCDGNSVGTLTPLVQIQKVNVPPDPDGTVTEATSTSNPTSGTTMRYDSTAQQYIYNLATKGLVVSDYRVIVSDSSFAAPVTAIVTLKK